MKFSRSGLEPLPRTPPTVCNSRAGYASVYNNKELLRRTKIQPRSRPATTSKVQLRREVWDEDILDSPETVSPRSVRERHESLSVYNQPEIRFFNNESSHEDELVEALDLSGRKLSVAEIAQAICMLHDNASYVDLSFNTITSIPRLPHRVCVLSLSGNQISSIRCLEYLTSLEELDVSRNEITSLCGLHNSSHTLRTLNASHNKLTAVQGLEMHINLQRLDLSDNMLSCVADIRALSCNFNLCELRIEGNAVREIRSSRQILMDLLPSLITLDGLKLSASPAVRSGSRQSSYSILHASKLNQKGHQNRPEKNSTPKTTPSSKYGDGPARNVAYEELQKHRTTPNKQPKAKVGSQVNSKSYDLKTQDIPPTWETTLRNTKYSTPPRSQLVETTKFGTWSSRPRNTERTKSNDTVPPKARTNNIPQGKTPEPQNKSYSALDHIGNNSLRFESDLESIGSEGERQSTEANFDSLFSRSAGQRAVERMRAAHSRPNSSRSRQNFASFHDDLTFDPAPPSSASSPIAKQDRPLLRLWHSEDEFEVEPFAEERDVIAEKLQQLIRRKKQALVDLEHALDQFK